jgi:5-methylcytosine-specific restriction endonuclease McrA
MSTKRKVTAAMKKQIAGRQRFMCAATVQGYTCPLNGLPFDEAGYEIDHIVPLSEGGSNDASNLQALCLMCHRVKSNRACVGIAKTSAPKKKAWNIRDTEIGYLYASDSD